MSVAAAVKAFLVGKETGALISLLPGVQVSYTAPGDLKRTVLYAGSVTGPVALAAMAGGGRVKRTEELTLLLHVRVYQPGQKTTEATDARAVEIGDVIADYLAGNWTLDGLAGLKKATVDAVDLGEGWLDDDGAGSTLTLAVGLMSYLT